MNIAPYVNRVRPALFSAALLGILCGPLRAADVFIVKEGQPQAEIIIAAQPQRTVRLAAQELQASLEKISGARLRIVTEPSGEVPVKLYVGRSPATDRLNISADGLRYGAYRIVSGDDWLVFIGDDTDFTPVEPWARNNSQIASGQLQNEWNKITGAQWGVPHAGMYKNRIKLPGSTGKPDGAATEKNGFLELWGYDERGSFNAVCGFLRSLGMRWYLPGELGEVVPRMKSIPLPDIDETVQPDFPIRRFNVRFSVVGYDTAMWAMRLGIRDPHDIQVAHGLDTMTGHDEVFAQHPDWFALYGGKRHYQPEGNSQLCYSNEELLQETVRYVRAQFDHYGTQAVSVMPPDGYTAICQCPKCEGKDTPDRGNRGLLSDYVWDFVNRVAKEVGKTHPDQKILNCAYGVYTLPPQKIAKLEPNVVVSIVGGRRPTSNKPEQQHELSELRAAWAAKVANPIIIFENYPFTDRGWYLPAFVPHSLGESINATKGISQGEDIWLSVGRDFDKRGIGFNHFLVYFTTRMYWGGEEQDVDAMFREYCRVFYGPAENEMVTFFNYCEENWQDLTKDKSKTDTALAYFAAAQSQVDPQSIYGRRIALIDDFLKNLRNKSTQLGRKRGPVPKLRLVNETRSPITIDGKLDEEAWTKCPVSSTGHLRELQTGRVPTFETSVKTAWRGGDLYFAIRCNESPGGRLNVTSTKKDDSAIWYGDLVEVLLETESHSYYQIAVNPAGAVADLDRAVGKASWFNWDAQAEVSTHVAADHWIVEMRIPVTQDENDPLHQVIGRKPILSLPWHINICRQRIRDDGTEHSAFSPTGTASFHEIMKFAHFYNGRSNTFEAAELEGDFLTAYRRAADLSRRGNHSEALSALSALADGNITDFQESAVLEDAVANARRINNSELVAELTARIPIGAVKKTVQMQTLLEERKAAEVVAQFAGEDIAAWPFWKRGDGYFARGRAYAILKAGKEAEADLLRALEFTLDSRVRQGIWLALAVNREHTLQNKEAALTAYGEVLRNVSVVGGADEFRAVESIARIHTGGARYDAALVALDRVDLEKLQGYWRGVILLARARTLAAAGRRDEAFTIYRSVAADDAVTPQHRDAAHAALKEAGEPQ